MGNAEKAIVLSLLAHAFLSVGIVAIFDLPSQEGTGAVIDVASVELSLADDDSASVATPVPVSTAQNAQRSPSPPDEPLPPSNRAKVPEAIPVSGTVEIIRAREPTAVMHYEKPPPTAATPISGADQARVDAPAGLRRSIIPKYPRSSRQRGEEGQVRLKLTVDASGVVTRVLVAVSSGFEALDAAAVKAARAAMFNPARRNGRAVESTVNLPIVFKLK